MLKKSLLIALSLLLLAGPRLFAQSAPAGPAASPAAGTGISSSPTAALRVGDSVDIHIAGVPAEDMQQFGGNYTIDESGMINLPYIGLVKVASLTPSQAQVTIQNALVTAQIYTNPTISVNPANASRFVSVSGSVKQPGRLGYTSDMTVMSAINAAGGKSDFAGDTIRLIRKGQVIKYSFKKLDKYPSMDPPVQPGDQIEMKDSVW